MKAGEIALPAPDSCVVGVLSWRQCAAVVAVTGGWGAVRPAELAVVFGGLAQPRAVHGRGGRSGAQPPLGVAEECYGMWLQGCVRLVGLRCGVWPVRRPDTLC
eukprot:COSAG02_NODE_1563_length_11913_cov_6.216438_2_plen_103_part_00